MRSSFSCGARNKSGVALARRRIAMRGAFAITSLPAPTAAFAQDAAIDKGDTAWMLVSTLLVVLMIVPGLALFYGGLVRAKNTSRC
jgi:Amt family ammonium transporter